MNFVSNSISELLHHHFVFAPLIKRIFSVYPLAFAKSTNSFIKNNNLSNFNTWLV